MRNLIILLVFLLVIILTIIKEPIHDVIDAVAGGTNSTYSLTLDSIAGASDEHDGDDDD